MRFSLTEEGFSRSLRFSVPAAALGFFAGAVEGLVLPGGGKGGSLRVGQGRHHAATLPAAVLTMHHGHPHGEQAVIFTAEHAVIHVALGIPRLHGPGLAAQGAEKGEGLSGAFDSAPELMAALGYTQGNSRRYTLEELDNEEKDAEMSRCNSSVDFEA